MQFHDNAGMVREYYEYWERCGCEAIEIGKPYPRPLEGRHVSALLEMAWARARGEKVVSPLDDWPLALSVLANRLEEEGERKGERDYLALLAGLEGVEVKRYEVRLLSSWERLAIGKWALIEEFIKERGKLRREKARLQKKRKRVYAKRVALIGAVDKWGKEKKKYASVEELEARAMECERAIEGGEDRMAYMRAAKYWNQAEIRRQEIAMARKKEVVWEVREEMKGREEGSKAETHPERPEVELEVIRVGPNPRIVVCRYKLLAEVLIVKLKVHNNSKFCKGMKIKMVEQEGEEWEYRGGLPRHKGRW